MWIMVCKLNSDVFIFRNVALLLDTACVRTDVNQFTQYHFYFSILRLGSNSSFKFSC